MEPRKTTIADLGPTMMSSDHLGFFISDETVYGLFEEPKRTVVVISNAGKRIVLGSCHELTPPLNPRIVFSPSRSVPYGLVVRAIEWFANQGAEIGDPE